MFVLADNAKDNRISQVLCYKVVCWSLMLL